MPCCHSLLSAAVEAAARTPSWLHRLHAKEGLSFPSHLHIDDLFHAPPPLPPPSSSCKQLAVVPVPPPKPNQQLLQQLAPRSDNPSWPNPTDPQPPPIAVIAAPSDPPLKASGKKPRTRTARPKDSKAKARKRRRAAGAGGEWSGKTEVTVIDSSIDGWKAAKVLVRKGTGWKIRNKKASVLALPEPEGKRRAGLTSKVLRDKEKKKEKEKEATLQLQLQGNIHASDEDVMEDLDDPVLIQTLKRPRCSEPTSPDQSAAVLRLQSSAKKDVLASPKGDLKRKMKPRIIQRQYSHYFDFNKFSKLM